MKTETKTTGRRWSRRAITMAVIGGLFVVAIAAAAFALITASADVEGDVTSGTAAMSWTTQGGDAGLIQGTFIEYDGAGAFVSEDVGAIPSGVVCEAVAESDGTLTLNVSGLFPNEGCAFLLKAQNDSTLDLSGVDFVYGGNADYGTDGSDAKVEAWLMEYDGDYQPAALPTGVVAANGGAVFTSNTWLMVELPASATADGTTLSAAGLALYGESTGGR